MCKAQKNPTSSTELACFLLYDSSDVINNLETAI